jgi:hypothetical protein
MHANIGASIDSNNAVAEMVSPTDQQVFEAFNVSRIIATVLHDLGTDTVEIPGEGVIIVHSVDDH